MYNVIRQDDWDETINEIIGSTHCYDEAKWMKQTAREDEPDVCFYIREDISEDLNKELDIELRIAAQVSDETNEQRLQRELAEQDAYKTKDIIEAHEKQIAHCDKKIRAEVMAMAESNEERLQRELRELQENTDMHIKWLEDERERLLNTLDYLQRQVVLMA